jgi:NADH-quinone oxidoreductase subunit N
MVGVFSGEKSVTMVNGLAVALLIMAGLVLVLVTETAKPTMARSCPIPSPAS